MSAENKKILVINPGSTSTKIAAFEAVEGTGAENERLTELFSETLRHDAAELARLGSVVDQLDYRKGIVIEAIREQEYRLTDFAAFACRGGLVRQMPGGTYRVNDDLVRDSRIGVSGQHASNLGALIGHELELESGVPAYIVDPPVVNELAGRAKYSGTPLIERVCVFHALNQKAVARRYAESIGREYEDLNLLVCHMGGGISVGAHVGGKVIDTEDAVGGEGPFSPERAGSLPVNSMIDLCFSGEMDKDELKRLMTRGSGLLAYAGTNSVRDLLDAAAAGDTKVQEALDAFYYQVAKEIAAMSIAMKAEGQGSKCPDVAADDQTAGAASGQTDGSASGTVDQILLTGGIAHSQIVTGAITKLVDWIAPVTVFPGEDELLALTQGVLRVLRGEEPAKEY